MTSLNFTVSETYERAMFTFMHVAAVLNLVIAILTLYLLYFKTNKNSQRYKMCLINLVMWTTFMDIYFDILFVPLPLFPLLSGYCIGPVCALGLSLHYSMAIICFIVTGVCGGIVICYLFRNQAVMPAYYRFKLSNRDFKITCLVMYIFLLGPTVLMATAYGDTLKGEEYLREYHPAMLWITTKPGWAVYSTTSSSTMTIVMIWMSLLMFGFCCLLLCMLANTFYILGAQSHHMSERTKKFHRNLTFNLISQSVLLSSVLAIPLIVFAISFFTYAIPYEVNWAFFCCELLHSTVHSGSLILTTPSYKDTILVWFRIKKRKDVQSLMTTVSAMH